MTIHERQDLPPDYGYRDTIILKLSSSARQIAQPEDSL